MFVDDGVRAWPAGSLITRVLARQRALRAWSWLNFCCFGSEFGLEAEFRGLDAIGRLRIGTSNMGSTAQIGAGNAEDRPSVSLFNSCSGRATADETSGGGLWTTPSSRARLTLPPHATKDPAWCSDIGAASWAASTQWGGDPMGFADPMGCGDCGAMGCGDPMGDLMGCGVRMPRSDPDGCGDHMGGGGARMGGGDAMGRSVFPFPALALAETK